MKKILFVFTALMLLAACNNSSKKQESDQSSDEQTTVEQSIDEQALDETEVPALSFADVAGIYDSFNEDGGNEYRISLNDDGTATWNVIGSLHWTDYTYTIQGNTICLQVNDVETESECYDYDPSAKTLSSDDGTTYFLQDIDSQQ